MIEQLAAVGAVEVSQMLELDVAEFEHARHELVQLHHFRVAEADDAHGVLNTIHQLVSLEESHGVKNEDGASGWSTVTV